MATQAPTIEEQIQQAIEYGVEPDFAKLIGNLVGPISIRQADLLRQLASEVTEGVIIEVGSFRGKSTVALAHGAKKDIPVYAIDPHELFDGPFGGKFGPNDRRKFYETMLATGHWENVRLVNLPSTVVAAGWQRPVGLLWIDGDHNYDAVRADLTSWEPHLLPGAPVVLDDTDRGGPKQLLEELLAAGTYTVSEQRGKMRLLVRQH